MHSPPPTLCPSLLHESVRLAQTNQRGETNEAFYSGGSNYFDRIGGGDFSLPLFT